MPVNVLKGSYLVVTDWDGVDGTGTNDSGAPINAALAYASANGLVAWIPSGAQLLTSVTLNCMDNWTGASSSRSNNSHQLVGEAQGTRPIIRCTPDFAPSTSSPKAIIHGGMVGAAGVPAEAPEWSLWGALRNLDIRADPTNNAGAICVAWSAAQYTALRNLRIDATGGLAGIADGAGAGAFNENIEVIGGQRGIHVWATFANMPGRGHLWRNVKLNGQTLYAVDHAGYRGGVLVGVEIINPPAVAIRAGRFNEAPKGHILLKDASCIWSGSAGTLVSDADWDKVVVLRNVYAENCATIIDAGGAGVDVAGTPGAIVVADGAYTPGTAFTGSTGATGITATCVQQIDGTVTAGPVQGITTQAAASIPSDLRTRNAITPDLDAFSPNVIDAVDYGAAPNNTGVDSHAAIQTAIDYAVANGKHVFLRSGTYYGVGGIIREGDVRVFRAPGCRSVLYGNQSWTDALTQRDWLFKDDGDLYGAGRYDDVAGAYSNAWESAASKNFLGLMHVTQGRNCGSGIVVWGIGAATSEDKARHCYRFSGPNATTGPAGNAGGNHLVVMDGHQVFPNHGATRSHDYRKCMIDGVTEPLRIGSLDLERGGDAKNIPNDYFCEIVASTAVEIDVCKFEAMGPSILVRGNSHVLVDYVGIWTPANGADNTTSGMVVEAPAQVEASVVYRQVTSTTPAAGTLIIETGYGTVQTADRNKIIALYRRGTALDREAMFVPSTRPASGGAADPNATSSTTWIVAFQGAGAIAAAEIELAESIGGPDISGTATITSGPEGSSVANLTDNSDASNFTATGSVAVKFVFGSAKSIREIRLKGPASGNRPTGVQVRCVSPITQRRKRMANFVFDSFAAGELKTLRFNSRAKRLGIESDLAAKIAAV